MTPYLMREFFNGANIRYFSEKNLRKATSEEIEQYKTNKEANKYNL